MREITRLLFNHSEIENVKHEKLKCVVGKPPTSYHTSSFHMTIFTGMYSQKC